MVEEATQEVLTRFDVVELSAVVFDLHLVYGFSIRTEELHNGGSVSMGKRQKYGAKFFEFGNGKFVVGGKIYPIV